MSTSKGKLFELASVYKTYCKPNGKKTTKQKVNKPSGATISKKTVKGVKKKVVSEKGEHFDEGQPISLSYAYDEPGDNPQDSYEGSVKEMSSWESDRSEAFYVEPFDAEDYVEAPYREVNDSEDDRIERIVTGFSKRDDEEEEDEKMEEDFEKMKDMEGRIDDMLKSDDDDATAMSAPEFDDHQTIPTSESHVEDTTTSEPKGTPPLGEKQVGGYDASDEEFARDIGAILQGQKVYDADQKKAVGKDKPAHKPEPSARPSPKEESLDASKNEHKIFEKIAQSMAYANSYDLGAIALEEKFEIMDKEIEKEDVDNVLQTDPTTKAPADIKYAEVVEEEANVKAMVFEPEAPLDPHNGGRLIKMSDLGKGDLILAASGGSFGVLEAPQSNESIAAVYIGDRKVITKGPGGALEEKAFDADQMAKGVFAVLRHKDMTTDKGSAIADTLRKMGSDFDKAKGENWLKIYAAGIRPHGDVCSTAPDKSKCEAFAGKIFLGTSGNDGFLCSDSIINAFDKQMVGFVPPLGKEHNGALRYFGHLKNKP